jgi:CBS domain-containing protein
MTDPIPPDHLPERSPTDGHSTDRDRKGANALEVVKRAAQGASEVLGAAVSATERLGELREPVTERVETTVREAARRLAGSRATRLRRLQALNREPLANLFELHAEARMAPRRELGLQTIPVEQITGTAVEGPAQRGSDFLPLPAFRSGNWRGRWRRLRDAVDRMTILPPIEVLKTSDGYWVLDGHNRVAAALYTGQKDIDALVTAVRLPGEPPEPVEPAGSLEAMFADADELRAAATGRLTRGSSLEAPLHGPISPEGSEPGPREGAATPGETP